jgi:hypothetical protein
MRSKRHPQLLHLDVTLRLMRCTGRTGTPARRWIDTRRPLSPYPRPSASGSLYHLCRAVAGSPPSPGRANEFAATSTRSPPARTGGCGEADDSVRARAASRRPRDTPPSHGGLGRTRAGEALFRAAPRRGDRACRSPSGGFSRSGAPRATSCPFRAASSVRPSRHTFRRTVIFRRSSVRPPRCAPPWPRALWRSVSHPHVPVRRSARAPCAHPSLPAPVPDDR